MGPLTVQAIARASPLTGWEEKSNKESTLPTATTTTTCMHAWVNELALAASTIGLFLEEAGRDTQGLDMRPANYS